MLFGALALRFSQPPGCGTKALLSYARRKPASRRLIGVSVLQWFTFFYVFLRTFTHKVWRMIFTDPFHVAPGQHAHQENSDFQSVRCLLMISRTYESSLP